MIFFKGLSVTTGLAVKAVYVGVGYQLYQVLIAGVIFAEEYKMMGRAVLLALLVKSCAGSNIDLSLSEIGKMLGISRSGVYHRIKRISETADRLRSEKGE